MVKCLPEFEYFTVFLKNKNIIFKIRRSKVTDYAALICHKFLYFWQSVFTHRTAPPFFKLGLSASHCHIDFFDAVILKTGSHALWFN